MLIVGVSLAVAIGLPAQKGLYAAAPAQIGVLIDSGLIPGAIVRSCSTWCCRAAPRPRVFLRQMFQESAAAPAR
ncbi:hypothetical protein [Salinicola tamaricis]|uniref:hypothetical protein n=1 Tax=Salinicola tamaricis TaxID=1771309 RepID=UPI001F5C8452|nr:hypothetical protein [Salinicola tamaricis]